MKFTIYQHSLPGPRPYNQDRLAYSYSKDSLLLILADGMGGHRHGEVAAQLAISSLTDAFQEVATPVVPDPESFLSDQFLLIHEAIQSLALEQDLEDSPRTTLVAAILQDDTMYHLHVGDSRLYHFKQGSLDFRTEDHSIVQMLIKRGMITPAQAESHPEKHKVYNCLGGDRLPRIESPNSRPLNDGDSLLLCSDGVWSVLNDKDLAKILHAGSITESVPKLLEIVGALCGPEGDNMSAIGLQWGDKFDSSLAVSTAAMSLDATTTIINPVTHQQTSDQKDAADLSDDDIENAILEIQSAIHKSKT